MENGSVTYQNDGEMSLGTLQDMLLENVGKYVICELLVGLRSMTVREGILLEVGQDYFILQDPDSGDRVSCDLYSLKFLTVPNTAGRQPAAGTSAYCPYGYGRPAGGGGSNPGCGRSACWIRVD